MLKYLSTAVVLLSFAAPLLAAPASIPFVVQGNLPTTKARKAYLSYHRGTVAIIDSAVVSKGRFQFKGTVYYPQRAQVLLPPLGTSYHHMQWEDIATVYLEKGLITVTSTGRAAQAVSAGTPLNREHALLAAQTAPIQAQITAWYQAWARRPAAEQADTAIEHQADAQVAQLTKQLKAVYATYLRAHPAHPFSLYALEDYEEAHPEDNSYAALFQSLSPSLRTSVKGRLLQQQLERSQHTAVGGLAPNFSLPDSTGNQVELTQLRGHYVLIDFWASWCKPCRDENQTLVKTYATYHGKNFTIISISLDKQSARAAWLQAIQRDGLVWPQVSSLQGFQTEVAQQYAIKGIPQNFLLDPQGYIIAKNLRGEALPRKLIQVLNLNN